MNRAMKGSKWHPSPFDWAEMDDFSIEVTDLIEQDDEPLSTHLHHASGQTWDSSFDSWRPVWPVQTHHRPTP